MRSHVRMTVIIILLINFPIFILTYTVDPDEDRNPVELIESRGYSAQVHKVETADSYILTMYRIVSKSDAGSVSE